MRSALIGALAAAALIVSAGCSGGRSDEKKVALSSPEEVPCGTYDGSGCATSSERVDLEPPSFSNPTEITNPLFPISRLRSTVLLGHVDGKPFRTETTLLPGTRTVIWGGRWIEVLVSQYMAYLDGRLQEIALDRYAQADDGGVWYLGEDVFDYEDGTVSSTEGTWLAGREGPGAMIMPAEPGVGDVYRTENAPGIVFEEVTVKSVGRTVQGPQGPVPGAMVGGELHSDGSTEYKTFAPGYGEFRTASGGDLEAMALAVPTDSLSGPQPAELLTLYESAEGLLEAARGENWEGASATIDRMGAAWSTLREAGQPPMIAERLSDNLAALARAVKAEKQVRAMQKAIDVAHSVLDLELRYRPATEIDAERFHLHTQQLRLDATADDLAGATSEVATLEWIRDRFAHTLSRAGRAELDSRLRALRSATDARNIPAAADHAARLGARVRELAPGP
jgi:hypothetical protein